MTLEQRKKFKKLWDKDLDRPHDWSDGLEFVYFIGEWAYEQGIKEGENK